jgi:UDP-N-acetylglucosamine acyltransferase
MAAPQTFDIAALLRRIPSQYPFQLVDKVLDYDGGGSLSAVKNVTGSEGYFEGHFPGAPVMPGVLLLEALAQAAGLWLIHAAPDPSLAEVRVVGFDDAKFRRPVTPGDQLLLSVHLERSRGVLYRFHGEVRIADQRVAEATVLLQCATLAAPEIDPAARVAPTAEIGPGVRIGPFCIVGPAVRIGSGTTLRSHVIVDGDTMIGSGNTFYPFSSIGVEPQDLKYAGEPTRTVIGDRNTFREGTSVHRGTHGGGGTTTVGSDNFFMTGAHIAHDCIVGNHTIFANQATLAGHVSVADYATVGAFAAVHQFSRVGLHGFLGGMTAASQDVLPYSLTVGNRACLFGINHIGLLRRGFSREAVAALRAAYRTLTQAGLPLREAVARIEAGTMTDEVRVVVDFIRTSKRGVIIRRRRRSRGDDSGDDA